jgi:hypothetical protein
VALGEIIEARMEAADRRQRPVALLAPVVRRDPGVDGVAHERRDRPTRSLGPLLQEPKLFIGELHLHTSHLTTVA